MIPYPVVRKIWFSLCLCCAVVALVSNFWVMQSKLRVNGNRIKIMNQGYQAYEEGDLQTAIDRLSEVRPVYFEDPKVFRTLYRSALEIRPRGDYYLEVGRKTLKDYVLMSAWDTDARIDLLNLYLRIGYFQTALSLADNMLATDPVDDDEAARRAEAICLFYVTSSRDAIAIADAYLADHPREFLIQILRQEKLLEREVPPAEVLADAQAHFNRAPDDPGLGFVLASAELAAGRTDEATERFIAVAKTHPDDPQLLNALVRRMDALGAHEAATQLINDVPVIDPSNHPDWLNIRLHRWIELEDWDHILALADPNLSGLDIDPEAWPAFDLTSPRQSSTFLGIAGYAARQQDRQDLLTTIVATLERQAQYDPRAEGWLGILNADEGRELAAFETAVEANESYYIFKGLLGRRLAATGEYDQAIHHLSYCVQYAQLWPEIWLDLTRAYLAVERMVDSAKVARFARTRSDTVEARLLGIQSAEFLLNDRASDAPARLLAEIEELQTLEPLEPWSLLTKVRLLLRLNQIEAARVAALQLIEHPNAIQLDPQIYRELSAASHAGSLGLDQAAAEIAMAAGGDKAEAVARRAEDAIWAGEIEFAEAAIETLRARTDDPAAQAAWAGHLDRWQPAEAEAAWIQVVERFPGNPLVLKAASRSLAVRTERTLHRKVIAQLREATSDGSATWRIERARYLLTDPRGTPAPQVREARELLEPLILTAPTLADARYLLAETHVRAGTLVEAARILNELKDSRPELISVAIRLAEIYQDLEAFYESKSVLDHLLRDHALTPAALADIAELYRRQGEADASIRVLESIPTDQTARSNNALAQLAESYWQAGRMQEAAAILDQLLQNPTPATLGLAARFHAAFGRTEVADAAIAQLRRLPATEAGIGEVDMILASYFTERGEANEAVAAYQRATAARPNDPRIWAQMIRYQLSIGQFNEAVAAAETARDAGLGPSFEALVRNREAAQILMRDRQTRPLVIALMNPLDHEAALDAIMALQSNRKPIDAVELVYAEHRSSLSVSNLYARLLIDADRFPAAAEVASATMRSHPQASEPAAIAADAFTRVQRWADAAEAAKTYRARITGATPQADLLVAQTLINIGQVSAAADALRPYLDEANLSTGLAERIRRLYVTAMVRGGRGDEVEARFLKDLETSPEWRSFWMTQIAALEPSSARCGQQLERIWHLIPAGAIDEVLDWASAGLAAHARTHATGLPALVIDRLTPFTQQPDAPIESLALLAMAHEAGGATATSATVYERLLERQPNHAGAMNNLALVRSGQERHDEALNLSRRAIEINPENANFWDTRSEVLTAAGRHDEAVEAVAEAIRLEPNGAGWRDRLSNVLRDAGRSDQIIQILREIRNGQ